MGDDSNASSTLLDAAAASTAARGVCFHNAHPAARRWLPLKAPAVFAVARGRAANTAELCQRTAPTWAVAGGMHCLEPAGRLAAELLPVARALAARTGDPALQRLQPERWSRFWEGQLYDQQPGGRRLPGFGQGGGGGEEDDEEAEAALGLGGAAASEDVIEESEDEDDW